MTVSVRAGDSDDHGNRIELIVAEGDWRGGGDKRKSGLQCPFFRPGVRHGNPVVYDDSGAEIFIYRQHLVDIFGAANLTPGE
ncbi:Uncharacterised protein [Klebsiella pneumoniae]|nr:Uncharacterised protein [Klebsiella pneumoniae]